MRTVNRALTKKYICSFGVIFLCAFAGTAWAMDCPPNTLRRVVEKDDVIEIHCKCLAGYFREGEECKTCSDEAMERLDNQLHSALKGMHGSLDALRNERAAAGYAAIIESLSGTFMTELSAAVFIPSPYQKVQVAAAVLIKAQAFFREYSKQLSANPELAPIAANAERFKDIAVEKMEDVQDCQAGPYMQARE